MQQETARRVCQAKKSQRTVDATRRGMVDGRVSLFETLISPVTVADTFGIPAAVATQKLQDQSEVSRAAILSSTDSTPGVGVPGPSLQELIADAPVIVGSQGGFCGPSQAQSGVPDNPRPGMPQRAPTIVQSSMGPLYFRGADPTFDVGGGQGLTGYSPSWSDAFVMRSADGNPPSGVGVGFMDWARSNPWLLLAAAGAGVFALSRRSKR